MYKKPGLFIPSIQDKIVGPVIAYLNKIYKYVMYTSLKGKYRNQKDFLLNTQIIVFILFLTFPSFLTMMLPIWYMTCTEIATVLQCTHANIKRQSYVP